MDGNEKDRRAILEELRGLRRAVLGVAVLVVLCTAAVLIAEWNVGVVLLLLILLGMLLAVCIVAAVVGVAGGKTAGWISTTIRPSPGKDSTDASTQVRKRHEE
jgi:hypothetical protein